MNKFSIIAGIMMILMAVSALAVVKVDHKFNVPNVQSEAHDCLDFECNTVTPGFSGNYPSGTTTSNSKIRIKYPTQLATPDGYAVYFFSDGWLPKEYKVTLAGKGTTSVDHEFHKIPVCSSVVDTFTVTNDAHPNQPLVVSMTASLDATTRSAFTLTDNGVGYVPQSQAILDDHYSADTRITLTIKNSAGAVVGAPMVQDLTAANGNPLFAGENRPIEFSWTPTYADTFTAEITTEVIDNQCASQVSQSSTSNFDVLPDLPADECYTILNGLYADPSQPIEGRTVTAQFTKISNHAAGNQVLTPVPTAISWSLSGPSTASSSFTAAANPDNYNPSTQTFSFTPTTPGMHTVTVNGVASSPMCSGLANHDNTVTLNVNVLAEPKFKVSFQIADGHTGNPVEGATITIAGQTLTTDADGKAATSKILSPADYEYTISKAGYTTLTGVVSVVNVDMELFLTLTPDPSGHRAKVTFEVRNANGQAPIQGATVDFRSEQKTTDSAGFTTAFTQVPAGTHGWTVSAAGYDSATGSVVTDGNQNEHVIVTLSQTNDGGAQPVTIHVINGNTNGDVQGATVTITGGSLPTNGLVVTTDAAGLATFASVPQGAYSYFVSFSDCDDANGGFNVDAVPVFFDVVLAGCGGDGTSGPWDVTFHVYDSFTTANLPGANVVFGSLNGVTDIIGEVLFQQIDNGVYAYSVTLVDYYPATGTVQVADADLRVEIPLVPINPPVDSYDVTFIVQDAADGSAINGATINVAAQAGTTNAAGTVVFNNVFDGTYTYNAAATGYNPATGIVTVSGADVTVIVQLTRTDGGPGPEEPEDDELGLMVERIRLPEVIAGQGEVLARVTFKNDGDKRLDQIRVTMISQELGMRGTVGPLDLGRNDRETRYVLLRFDDLDLTPGLHAIRVTISNDDIRRVIHRHLEVIE